MDKSVSILIPCFNAEKYLNAAIESAMAQTWPNKEIIVVNDGSTDGSGEILEKFRARGVKVLHQSNTGQCAAANRAFAESKGGYVKFFDADDVLSPDCIEKQMIALDGRQDAIAMCGWARFYNQLKEAKFIPDSTWETLDPINWLLRAWEGGGRMMQCGMFLIPRPILNQAGLWDERLSLINDFEFFARVLLKAQTIQFTPGAKLYYRSGLGASLSAKSDRKAVESALLSLLLGTGHLLKVDDSPRVRRACANLMQQHFVHAYYPEHPDLLRQMSQRIQELGGADRVATGSPGFEFLKIVIGWRMARRVEKFAARHGFNRAGLMGRLKPTSVYF